MACSSSWRGAKRFTCTKSSTLRHACLSSRSVPGPKVAKARVPPGISTRCNSLKSVPSCSHHWIDKLEYTKSTLAGARGRASARSEEHTSELQSRGHLVCRLLLE